MKFIANTSMCEPTYYVPLSQAAEAAGTGARSGDVSLIAQTLNEKVSEVDAR